MQKRAMIHNLFPFYQQIRAGEVASRQSSQCFYDSIHTTQDATTVDGWDIKLTTQLVNSPDMNIKNDYRRVEISSTTLLHFHHTSSSDYYTDFYHSFPQQDPCGCSDHTYGQDYCVLLGQMGFAKSALVHHSMIDTLVDQVQQTRRSWGNWEG